MNPQRDEAAVFEWLMLFLEVSSPEMLWEHLTRLSPKVTFQPGRGKSRQSSIEVLLLGESTKKKVDRSLKSKNQAGYEVVFHGALFRTKRLPNGLLFGLSLEIDGVMHYAIILVDTNAKTVETTGLLSSITETLKAANAKFSFRTKVQRDWLFIYAQPCYQEKALASLVGVPAGNELAFELIDHASRLIREKKGPQADATTRKSMRIGLEATLRILLPNGYASDSEIAKSLEEIYTTPPAASAASQAPSRVKKEPRPPRRVANEANRPSDLVDKAKRPSHLVDQANCHVKKRLRLTPSDTAHSENPSIDRSADSQELTQSVSSSSLSSSFERPDTSSSPPVFAYSHANVESISPFFASEMPSLQYRRNSLSSPLIDDDADARFAARLLLKTDSSFNELSLLQVDGVAFDDDDAAAAANSLQDEVMTTRWCDVDEDQFYLDPRYSRVLSATTEDYVL